MNEKIVVKITETKQDKDAIMQEYVQSSNTFVEGVSKIYKSVNKAALAKLYSDNHHLAYTQVWSYQELEYFQDYMTKLATILGLKDTTFYLQNLNILLPKKIKADPAGVFLSTNFVQMLKIDPRQIMTEMLSNVKMDDKKISYGKITNKVARKNTNFVDLPKGQRYEKMRHPKVPELVYRNYSYDVVPTIKLLRDRIQLFAGPWNYKFVGFQVEVNYYYNDRNPPEKNTRTPTGIGWHGDKERGGEPTTTPLNQTGTVAGINLGTPRRVLFMPFHKSRPISIKIDDPTVAGIEAVKVDKDIGSGKNKKKMIAQALSFTVSDGYFYIMSSKAVGKDWKHSSILPTWRHAAGDKQYTGIRGVNNLKDSEAAVLTFSAIAETDSSAPQLRKMSPLAVNQPETQVHRPGPPIFLAKDNN